MASMKSKTLIYGGLLLIAAALCLVGYNLWDAQRAAGATEQIVQNMEMQENATLLDTDDPADSSLPEAQIPAYILDPTIAMPTVEVDGNKYIGILKIPSLELTLPVMSDWSYPKLKLAPCRYAGSAYLSDLVIAAHNYSAHFGALGSLDDGAVVVFTDVESNIFTYAVSEVEQIPATAVEEMESGDWDLTLFTCTIGGKARIAVRCELASDSYSQ